MLSTKTPDDEVLLPFYCNSIAFMPLFSVLRPPVPSPDNAGEIMVEIHILQGYNQSSLSKQL
jgi:hypothetical protein